MNRRAQLGAPAALLALLAGVSVAGAPAAGAGTRPAGLLVSADGTTWSAGLGRPLFDPTDLWVPGESRTSTFWVRNPGRTPASVRLAVLVSRVDDLVGSGAVTFAARVDDEPWQPVLRDVGESPLNVVAVPVSAARRIDVRAAFRAGSRNATQASEVALRFVVQLSEALVPPRTTELPSTGMVDLRLPLLVAAGCLAFGVALVRRRRPVQEVGRTDG